MPRKWLTWVVVGLLIAAAGWYSFMYMQTPSRDESSQADAQKQQAATQQGATQGGTQRAARASGSSDADLDAGLNSLGTQMDSTAQASDSAGSFDDQPVQQTE